MFRLIKHEALDAFSLIDLLTLSYLKPEHVDEIGDQFYLALQVATWGLKGADRRNAERLIWRRCYLRDDWKQVNETNNKADVDQLEAVGATAAYSAMFAIAAHRKCTRLGANAILALSAVTNSHFSVSDKSDESFYPVMKPSEAVGVFTDHLDRRFNDMDENFRNKLLDAMKWEDSKLRTYIEKHQLDSWHGTVLEEAERTVTREYDLRTQNQAAASSPNGHMNGDGAAKGLYQEVDEVHKLL
jgi:nuclear pore complex protein Nup133